MKIACIAYYLPPVDRIGSGVQAHYLANAYARAGHEVTMFSPYAQGDSDALYRLKAVPVGETNRTFRFARNLRKEDFSEFDLIHAHMDDYWLAGKKRPYHIRTFHGSCLAEVFNAPDLRGKVRLALLGISEIASCFIAQRKACVSKDTLKYCPTVREVIGCGVDPELFHPGTFKSEHPSIFFIGTMDERKRGSALLRIFQEEIRPEFPDAELWIAREPHPVVADGVKWFGAVPTPKLVELYQQAWVFCLPSSYEGFGVPYIEAMACGVPVVATPNPGAMEVLQQGKYGSIGELPLIGEKIKDLLRSATERDRWIRAGMERAKDYHWEQIVARYLEGVKA